MTIQARLGAGTRDYLPQDMIPRQKMLEIIRETFEIFGFLPLDTPGLELEEVLTGGDPAFKMNIFQAGLRNSEEQTLALRFDLTVPLARVVAQYGSQIEKPFKRYQTGKVWRGEKPQAGRFREFVQFDADIVGTSRMAADAEIVALMNATISALGFKNFVAKLNNRKILNGLAEYIGFPKEKTADVLRAIDKMDKNGWDGVSEDLADNLGFSKTDLGKMKAFLDLTLKDATSILGELRVLMANSPVALEGINELEEIGRNLVALQVPKDRWVIDLSVARGLGYYTGPVFETVLTDLPSIGSIFSGGRYDDLVERFGVTSFPAVGASVGVDRIFAAMEKMNLVRQEKTVSKVLVLNFDATCEAAVQSAVSALRTANIPSEIYLGKELTLKAQLAYAVRQEFPIVVIIGDRERETSTAQVKNMRARTQETASANDLVSIVKRALDL